MNMYIKLMLSLPRSILFNLRYLPWKKAIKMPFLIVYNAKINIKGQIILDAENIHPGMIRFGTHEADACEENETAKIVVQKDGRLVFNGRARIGHGSKIHVNQGGEMIIGDMFAVSSSSKFICYKRMVMGKDIQFSWGCQVMDSDTHHIYDESGKEINTDKEVCIGNKVWIGSSVVIMKGTQIPDNCVIGACSFVSGSNFAPDTIIFGIPAKSVKKIGGWRL